MNIFKRFFPLTVLSVCLCGLIYLSVQQSLRLNANDPQIQLVEDTAVQLSTTEDTFQITSLPRVNIASSLSPFVIIYNADGKVISSSGELDGKIPTVPRGVLAYTKEHDDDRFTWQPQDGVRIAAVVKHFTGRTDGYILSGRSLAEVEKRENIIQLQVVIGWVVTEVALLVAVILTSSLGKKKK